jgi:ribonuclease P protein component
MGETHIPAEQPEAEEEARVPASDAQSRGPRGDSTPSHQGPREPLRLIWRVRGQSSFRALARGRRRRAGNLEVRTVAGPGNEPARVAYSVGRNIGDAVTRNRVRRRLRAAVQSHGGRLESGATYLVRARPGAESDTFAELSDTLRAILGELAPENS